jgi:hypothetical protein
MARLEEKSGCAEILGLTFVRKPTLEGLRRDHDCYPGLGRALRGIPKELVT